MTTRFRLPASGTPTITPAAQSYTHNAATTRINLLLTDATALATNALAPDSADHLAAGDTFFYQFISRPLASGIVFSNGATIKTVVQTLEANAANNLRVQLFINIISADGSAVQRTIRSKIGVGGSEINTALRSILISTTQDGANYTTVDGDRLLVEYSLTGTPTSGGGTNGHNGSIRIGSDGAGGDLAENETQTGTTLNPWIEFAPTITELITYKITAARFTTIAQAYKNPASRFTLNGTTTKDVQARLVLTAPSTRDVAARFVLKVVKDAAARFFVGAPNYKHTNARFSLFSIKDIRARFGLRATSYGNAAARFFLANASGFFGIYDTFTRSASDSWGTMDSGHDWGVPGDGTAANFDVDGSQGTIVLPTDGVDQSARVRLAGVTQVATDVEGRMRVTPPHLTAGAVGHSPIGFIVRWDRADTQHHYHVAIESRADSTNPQLYVYEHNHNAIAGGLVGLTDYIAAPGQEFWLRARVTGANPTHLQAKGWLVGDPEPTDWQLDTTHGSAGVSPGAQHSGAFGVAGFGSNTERTGSINSVELSFDSVTSEIGARFTLIAASAAFKDAAARLVLWGTSTKDAAARFIATVRGFADPQARFTLQVRNYKNPKGRFRVKTADTVGWSDSTPQLQHGHSRHIFTFSDGARLALFADASKVRRALRPVGGNWPDSGTALTGLSNGSDTVAAVQVGDTVYATAGGSGLVTMIYKLAYAAGVVTETNATLLTASSGRRVWDIVYDVTNDLVHVWTQLSLGAGRPTRFHAVTPSTLAVAYTADLDLGATAPTAEQQQAMAGAGGDTFFACSSSQGSLAISRVVATGGSYTITAETGVPAFAGSTPWALVAVWDGTHLQVIAASSNSSRIDIVERTSQDTYGSWTQIVSHSLSNTDMQPAVWRRAGTSDLVVMYTTGSPQTVAFVRRSAGIWTASTSDLVPGTPLLSVQDVTLAENDANETARTTRFIWSDSIDVGGSIGKYRVVEAFIAEKFADIVSRFVLAVASTKDTAARFNLVVARDAAARFVLASLNLIYIDAAARFVLLATSLRDAPARAIVTVQSWKDAPARAVFIAQGYKDAATRSVLTVRSYLNAAARFTLIEARDAATRFILQVRSYKDVPARFYVTVGGYKDASARVILTVARTVDADARFILQARSFTDANARVILVVSGYRDAAARAVVTVRGYLNASARFVLVARSYVNAVARFVLIEARDAATRFVLTVASTRDAPARFVLNATGYKNVAARAMFAILKTIPARFSVIAPGYADPHARFAVTGFIAKDAMARFRILPVAVYKDVATRTVISVQNLKDANARFRLRATGYKDAAARAIFTVRNYKDVAARFRLTASRTRDAAARVRVTVRGYLNVGARAVFTAQTYRNIPARLRLVASRTRDAGARARLVVRNYRDSRARTVLVAADSQNAATRYRTTVRSSADAITLYIVAGVGYVAARGRVRIDTDLFSQLDCGARFRLAPARVREYRGIVSVHEDYSGVVSVLEDIRGTVTVRKVQE